ncbi:MAG: Wzz/FepE/Etk N-terminal domain-containing protein [Armatimonadota bacterium]
MEEIELRAFFRMLVQERRVILGVMAAVMLLCGAVTFWVLPRQYTATATMLYNDNSASAAGALASTLGLSFGTSGPAPWFEMILTSRDLARKMVAKYDLVKALKAKSEGDAIAKLHNATTVTVKSDAKAIQLSVVFPGTPLKYPGNPRDVAQAKLAADVVNDMVAYLNDWLRTKDYRTSTIQRKFIESQLQQVLDEINGLRSQLLGSFRSGVFAPDAQAQAWLTALGSVEEEVATTRAQLAASRLAARAGASTSEVTRLAGSADLDLKVGGLGAGLRKQITDLEVQLRHEVEVNHKTDDHPDVAQLRQSIRELKSKLSTELDIIKEARQLEQTKLSTQLNMGVGRWTVLQSRIAALPARGLEVAELKRKLDSGAQLVDLLTKQLLLARINEAQETQHFDVLDPAEAPRAPSGPSMFLGLAVALAAGMLCGLMAGAAKHFLQRALRDV